MAVYPTPGKSLARPPSINTLLYFEHKYPRPGNRAVRRRPLLRSTFATWRTAELGFFGDIVASLVTIPFACGHFFNIGVREKVGFFYFRPGLRIGLFRFTDCIHVAIFILY